MKKIACIFAGCLLAAGAGADTILIDYDDGVVSGGHDVSVNAGDFNAEALMTGAGWDLNYGTGAGQWADNNVSGVGSAGNLVLGVETDLVNKETFTIVPAVDTGATIVLGQTFDISFMWRDAFNWDDGADTVSMVLFYTTDNLIGGAATEVLTFESALSAANNSYQIESATAVDYDIDVTSAIGKNLFVRFDTTATLEADGKGEFARLDNVYVSVSVIPEPATLGLISAFGAGLLFVRRCFVI